LIYTSGQAIPVELGQDRGTLWVLLRPRNDRRYDDDRSTSPEWIVPELFQHPPRATNSRPRYVRSLREIRGIVHPTLNQLPQMVVLPGDQLPIRYKWLGPGPGGGEIKPAPEFVGATIEIVDEPPTTGIRDRLRWLERPGALRAAERVGLTQQNFEQRGFQH
jgi:hypothetical protein